MSYEETENPDKDLKLENKFLRDKTKFQETKLKYQEDKLKIHQKGGNRGEKDEILAQLDLLYFDETKQYDKLIEIFGDEASDGIEILDMETNCVIKDINKISKSSSWNKADCKIKMKKTNNVYSISIKSKNGSKFAIINHTHRNAKIFQEGGILYDYVSCLDKILQEYIDKRKNKEINEDLSISDLMCLKDDYSLKEKFLEILSYFVFDGSGRGDSKQKANALIIYHNNEINFINCDNLQNKKKYIDSIYDKIVLSLRNKGMPKNIPDYCKPWVFNDIKDGSIKHKGSLHLRVE